MRSEISLFQSQLLIRPGQDIGGVGATLCALGNAAERVGSFFLPPQSRYTVVINASGLAHLDRELGSLSQKRGSPLKWVITAAKIVLLLPLFLLIIVRKFLRRRNFTDLLAKTTAEQQKRFAPSNQPNPNLYKGCGTTEAVLHRTFLEACPNLEILTNPTSAWSKAALTLLLHSKIEDGKMKWGEVTSSRPTIYLVTLLGSHKEIRLMAPDLLNGRNQPCDHFDEILELAIKLQKLEQKDIDLLRLTLSGQAPKDCSQEIREIAKKVTQVGAHLRECHHTYSLQSWSANGPHWQSAPSLDLTPPDPSLFSEKRAAIRTFEELWQHELAHAASICPARYTADQRNQVVRLLALYHLLKGAVCSKTEERILWMTPHLPLCFSPVFEVEEPESYPDELLSDLHPLFFRNAPERELPLAHDIAYQLARGLCVTEKISNSPVACMWTQELSRQLEQHYPEIVPPTKDEELESAEELPCFVEQCLKYAPDARLHIQKNVYADFTPADPTRPLEFEMAVEFARNQYQPIPTPDLDRQPPGNCMLVALLTQAGIVHDPAGASLETWTSAIAQYRIRLAQETRKQAQKLKRAALETKDTFQTRKEMMIDRAKKIEENDWLGENELPLLSNILSRSIVVFSHSLFETHQGDIREELRRQQFFLNAKNELLPSRHRIFHPSTGPTKSPITITFDETCHYRPIRKKND